MKKLINLGLLSKAISNIRKWIVTEKITYDDLCELKREGHLLPGKEYRITDYETIVKSSDDYVVTDSHPFDIIVTATSKTTLSEEAKAIRRENDKYFKNSNLESWKIWYSLDNDESRFEWANVDKTGLFYDATHLSGRSYLYATPIKSYIDDEYIIHVEAKCIDDTIRTFTFDGTDYDNSDEQIFYDVLGLGFYWKRDNGYIYCYNLSHLPYKFTFDNENDTLISFADDREYGLIPCENNIYLWKTTAGIKPKLWWVYGKALFEIYYEYVCPGSNEDELYYLYNKPAIWTVYDDDTSYGNIYVYNGNETIEGIDYRVFRSTNNRYNTYDDGTWGYVTNYHENRTENIYEHDGIYYQMDLKYDILPDDQYGIVERRNTKGKGVIYRMIDEYNNDVPFDFKNIRVKGFGTEIYKDRGGDIYTTTDDYYYTFSDFNFIIEDTAPCKSDISMIGNCLNNTIKPVMYGITQKITPILFMCDSTENCNFINNKIESCDDVIFYGECKNNTIMNSERVYIGEGENNNVDSGCKEISLGFTKYITDITSNDDTEYGSKNITVSSGCENITVMPTDYNIFFGNGCVNVTTEYGYNCSCFLSNVHMDYSNCIYAVICTEKV